MTPVKRNGAVIGAENAITERIRERLAQTDLNVSDEEGAVPDAVFCVHIARRDGAAPDLDETAAWPLLEFLKQGKADGRLPRYAVFVLAGTAPELLALTQAQLHYVTADTLAEDLHANIVYADYYAPALLPQERAQIETRFAEEAFINDAQIAEAAVMLTSGWMDGMKAQILTLRGARPAAEDILIKG